MRGTPRRLPRQTHYRSLTVVKPLTKLLQAAGNEIFIDQENLDYGSNWMEQLERAISSSKRLLLFWSKNAADSEFVRKEWMHALSEGCVVVPVMLDVTPLPNELQQYRGTSELQQITKSVQRLARVTRWVTRMALVFLVTGSLGYVAVQQQESVAKKPDIVLRGGKPTKESAYGLERFVPITLSVIGLTFGVAMFSYAALYRSRRNLADKLLRNS